MMTTQGARFRCTRCGQIISAARIIGPEGNGCGCSPPKDHHIAALEAKVAEQAKEIAWQAKEIVRLRAELERANKSLGITDGT